MKREEFELAIRRILVALDASPHSLAALEAAAELAEQFHAELLGLFVEDVNLLRLAQLPFTHEVRFFTASRRRLESEEIERHLRTRAREMRRTFRVLLERREIHGTFRVTRGPVARELLAAATDADMIILGKAGWSPARRRRLGSTARTLVFEAPSMTLILQDGACLGTPVLVVYDGSTMGRKALIAATNLMQGEEGLLTVILANSEQDIPRLHDEASGWIETQRVGARFHKLTRANVSRLASLVQVEGCGVLVLPARTPLLEDRALLTLLSRIDIPVLLVR